jgi:hypothetical protein
MLRARRRDGRNIEIAPQPGGNGSMFRLLKSHSPNSVQYVDRGRRAPRVSTKA